MSYRLLSTMTVPPGGWEYVEPRTGEKFKGGSLVELTAKVQKHRESNNLWPISETEVQVEIENQICQRVGHEWCQFMKAGQWGFSINFDKIRAGTRSLLGWAKAAVTGEDPYVNEAEANRRAEICSKCWANKAITGCYGCGLADRIREMLVQAKGSRWTQHDAKLHACVVCGCANAAQVWIKEEILAPAVTEEQRECYREIPNCWKAAL